MKFRLINAKIGIFSKIGKNTYMGLIKTDFIRHCHATGGVLAPETVLP